MTHNLGLCFAPVEWPTRHHAPGAKRKLPAPFAYGLVAVLLLEPLALGVPSTFGADSTQNNEAPLVGRKEPFCGAVGSGRFKVSMSASPKSLQAGDPILLTTRIEAIGAWTKAPERPDLANKTEYRMFQERFYIDNAQARPTPADGAWQFDFRLR